MNLSVPRNPPICAACQQGKLKATPHPRVSERTSNFFDLVHADLVPLDGISFGGSKYMLLFIEDSTRFGWAYFSSLKDAATIGPLTKTFILMILTQFNIIIKCWPYILCCFHVYMIKYRSRSIFYRYFCFQTPFFLSIVSVLAL